LQEQGQKLRETEIAVYECHFSEAISTKENRLIPSSVPMFSYCLICIHKKINKPFESMQTVGMGC
jgi:hypothetical protein